MVLGAEALMFGICVWAISSTAICINQNRELKLLDEISRKKVNKLRINFDIYKMVANCEIETLNRQLKKEICETEKWREKSQKLMRFSMNYDNSDINLETIKAVKYAMCKSHPDNGGKSEDFIRFKKCYDELTKNKKTPSYKGENANEE